MKILVLAIIMTLGDASIEQHRDTFRQMLDQTQQWCPILRAAQIQRFLPSRPTDSIASPSTVNDYLS